jgi:type I restriction enzyme M protein
MLIFNKARQPWAQAQTDRDKHILFIDASRDYQDGTPQNKLRDQDMEKILTTFKDFSEIEKYSHKAKLAEITEADFNLNIPRYVDTFEEEEEIDIQAVQAEIKQIETELAEVQAQMAGYLKELGID